MIYVAAGEQSAVELVQHARNASLPTPTATILIAWTGKPAAELRSRWFFVLFIFTVLAANIKSNFINNHPAFRLVLLIYMGFIYYSFQVRMNKKLIEEKSVV